MVRKCPCKGQRCVCTIEGAGGITLSGNGSDGQPYIPRFLLWDLVADDTSQANVTITGSGTSGDPWVVSIATLGGTVERTIYNADDTWVKPLGGSVAQVVVIGGGGGGGGAVPNTAAGGSGGAGGAHSSAWFPLDDLPDTVPVEVGSGGAGGRAISGLTNGTDGGDSWFGPYLYAPGGRGGKAQAGASQTQYTTHGGTAPDGGPGGAGAVRDGAGGIAAEAHTRYYSPVGGGMGGGTTISSTIGGAKPLLAWGGQGGDGGDLTAGFPGEDYGGGGGGGWSDLTDSSDGGRGGEGVVVVTVW